MDRLYPWATGVCTDALDWDVVAWPNLALSETPAAH